jgi:hypothetical protein
MEIDGDTTISPMYVGMNRSVADGIIPVVRLAPRLWG